MNSQLEGKQQEVLALQQSLTTVKQEKDTLEQELGGLVRPGFGISLLQFLDTLQQC